MSKQKKFKPYTTRNPRILGVWIGVFSTIGIATAVLTSAAPATTGVNNGDLQTSSTSTSITAQSSVGSAKADPTRTMLILAGAAMASVCAAAVMAKYLGMPHLSQTAGEPLSTSGAAGPAPILPTAPGASVAPVMPVATPAPAAQTTVYDTVPPNIHTVVVADPVPPVPPVAMPEQPIPGQSFTPTDPGISAEQIQSGQPPAGGGQNF